jgi:hypothetical protein
MPSEAKKTKKLSRAEAQELKDLPDAIEKAEADLRERNLLLSDPATHSGGSARIADATAALARAEAEVTRLMSRWEELEQKQAESAG